MDSPGGGTLESLKPLWRDSPDIGAEWALLQTQPIVLELETYERLTPEAFDALPLERRRELLLRAAERTTIESRGHAEQALSDIERGLQEPQSGDLESAKRLVEWKKSLLVLERWRLYFEPARRKRMDAVLREVDGRLWKLRADAMRQLIVSPVENAPSPARGADGDEISEIAVRAFLREREGATRPHERRFAEQLKSYSPALDPNRFFFLEPRSPLTKPILGGSDWTVARRHGIPLAPGLPYESYLFEREQAPWEPDASPLHAHVALHEGFHAVEPPGTFERIEARLEPLIGRAAASALAHALVEGITELRARRAFASLLRGGAEGQSPFAREVHAELEKIAPRPKDASYADWVEHWLGPAHLDHTYNPLVRIAQSLESSLGGLWALEDLLYRNVLGKLESVLEEQGPALRLMGRQLLFLVQYGTRDSLGFSDDFQLRNVLLNVVREIFSGRPYSEDEVRTVLALSGEYQVRAHALKSSLRPSRQDAFVRAAKSPVLSPSTSSSQMRSSLLATARRMSWVPRWVPDPVWRAASRVFARLGLPIL